MVVLAWYY